jgi:hypothetical protein
MADRYPVIYAGQDIDADTLISMIPQIVNKPSNTSRASTTTVSDDPDLTVELLANSTYFVEFHIHYAAKDTGKFKTQWTVPTGAIGNRCVIGPGSLANDANIDNVNGRFGVHNYDTSVTYGTRDHLTNQCYAQETSTVVTTNAGTLALAWAQGTSDTNNTTVFSTSLMRVTRIG